MNKNNNTPKLFTHNNTTSYTLQKSTYPANLAESLIAMVGSSQSRPVKTPLNNESIRDALCLWCDNPKDAATAEYGPIAERDTSEVTDMSKLFHRKWTFNDDISKWDVSKVTTMRSMFRGVANLSNLNICEWDVSRVTDMTDMFSENTSINRYSFSKWHDEMLGRPLNNESIRDAVRLWLKSPQDATAKYGPIEEWDTSAVTDMSRLFQFETTFNDCINKWDVSKVATMRNMFRDTSFNQDLSGWDVSAVTDMGDVFHAATAFNQDLRKWNVRKVRIMDRMFSGATSFDQDISQWDVSRVRSMRQMFHAATSFDQDISRWEVRKVMDMECMFWDAKKFNQDLSNWNVSGVTNMIGMFYGTAFNQNISGWDVSSVQRDTVRAMITDTPLGAILQRRRQVSSFFEGVYRHMPREERHEVFALMFIWERRRAFMLFLVHHGYLYSAHVASNYKGPGATKPRNEVVPCDAIFDVEDIYRYIYLMVSEYEQSHPFLCSNTMHACLAGCWLAGLVCGALHC